MRKRSGGIPLLVCLLSLGGAVGAQAQQVSVYQYPNGESRQEYVQQYARQYNLTKQQKKALDNQLKEEDRNWSRLSFRQQRQLARAREQRVTLYDGNTGSILHGNSNRDS